MSTTKSPADLSDSIEALIQRLMSSGISDLQEFTQFVDDDLVRHALTQVSAHNPVRGSRLSVEDIVEVLESEAVALVGVEEQSIENGEE